MMSNKAKILSFNVDGTFLPEKTGEVPESVRQAVKETRSKGHLVFISTGRIYPHTWQIRSGIEVDGCLCGCGMYALIEGRMLYCHHIPRERGIRVKKNVDERSLDGALEDMDGYYFHRTISKIPWVEELKAALREVGYAGRYDWEDDCYDFSKLCLASDRSSRCMGLFGHLKGIEVIDKRGGYYECVPRGYSKATAMDQVPERYDVSKDDAYVFGDSNNDLPMFQYATNCVLMGQHSEVLTPYAIFEIKDVKENSITYAMKELGIIQKELTG